MATRDNHDKQEAERLREEYLARGGKITRVPMFVRGERPPFAWTGYSRRFNKKKKEDK